MTVRKTLENHSQGGPILQALDNNTFDEISRRAFVRILVSELVEVYGSCYPPVNAKRALAKAVVVEFLQLRNTYSEEGWEHYQSLDNKKGFIEFRLLTMRKTLDPGKKKYKTAAGNKSLEKSAQSIPLKDQGDNFDKSAMSKKISLMQCKNPSIENRVTIVTNLDDTRKFRQHWIKTENPTISEVFEVYPRLLDYNGDMINREFEDLYVDIADNFVTTFPTLYTNKILQYVKEFRAGLYAESAEIEDKHLRALLLLVELLPASNATIFKKGKGKSKKHEEKEQQSKGKGIKRKFSDRDKIMPIKQRVFLNESLMRIVPDGTDIIGKVHQVQKDHKTNIQPYLITQSGQAGNKTFIQGDGWLISIHNASLPIASFDLLYKMYYILNLECPESLKNFYNFIDVFIFKMPKVEAKGVVASLHINISNMKVPIDINDENNDSSESDF